MANEPDPPHTVPAGIMDDFLGLKGPNGELMFQGKPALVADAPEDDEEED